MTTESGGEPARRGFVYQNWATAYYFLYHDEIENVYIERDDADFCFFFPSNEPPLEHYFESKSSNTGSLLWSEFKEDIAPEFAIISDEHIDDDSFVIYHIVSNLKLHRDLDNFLNDAHYERGMGWPAFETKWKRKRLDVLISSIERHTEIDDVNMALIGKFLPYIDFHFHSLEELVSKVEGFLEKKNIGRVSDSRDLILNKIHESSSAVINRSELEDELGFDLDKPGQSRTSSISDPGELQKAVRDIRERHATNAESIDAAQPIKDKAILSDFIQQQEKSGEIGPEVAEGIGASLEGEFKEIEESRRTERDASRNVVDDIDVIIEPGDSTSGEGTDRPEDYVEVDEDG